MEDNKITVTLPEEDRQELERRWKNAGIGNDFIFSRVMRKEELFLPLMQRIFPELKLCRVEKHVAQMTAVGPAGSKGVRYDVYSEINGRVFEVEMQMDSRGNEPKRTRYYQCMIDEQVLGMGEDYSKLPESYIIMISPKDFFGKGRHIYRFRNIETTDPSLELGDETMKIFLNSHGRDDVLPELRSCQRRGTGRRLLQSRGSGSKNRKAGCRDKEELHGIRIYADAGPDRCKSGRYERRP